MKLVKFSVLWALLVLSSVGANNSFGQKMTAEDVLAKHLESIGSAKSREAVKTRIIVSDVEFTRQKQNPIPGKSVFASSNEGAMFGINLNAVDYRLDKFSYDGKKVRVGYIMPGVRSILGNFILSYETLLKDGLLGGTLSSSWVLLDATSRKVKLTYDGTEKIDGKETQVLEFEPKGGSDLTVKMYFDSKNFNHVRTVYSRVIGAQMGGSTSQVSSGISRAGDGSGRRSESRYRIVEDFSNFKKFGDLTLPSAYKIDYTFTGNALSTNYLWKFKVTDASFNQPLGDTAFDIDAN